MKRIAQCFGKWIGLLVMASTACFADTMIVKFTQLPYSSGQGEYTGWTIATLNDAATNQLLMCDDFIDTTYVPSGDLVYDYSTLANDLSAGLDGLHFGTQSNAVQKYEAAAYLAWEYYQVGYNNPTGAPGPTPAQNQAAVDFNFAIWNLFDPGVSLTSSQTTYQSTALSFVGDAANAPLLDTIYARTNIYTPDPSLNSAGNQEFLQLQTPEPGSLWLIGTGAVLILFSRKVRHGRR